MHKPLFRTGQLLSSTLRVADCYKLNAVLTGTVAAAANLETAEKSTPEIDNFFPDDHRRLLLVQWTNGETGRFPYVWLRDNCPASHTYQLTEKCKGRKLLMADLDPDVRPLQVQKTDGCNWLEVRWPGGHVAEYSSDWLLQRNLSNSELRRRRALTLLDEKEAWSAHEYVRQHFVFEDFERLLSDDKSMHDCLTRFCRLGLVFFRNVPTQTGQLRRLVEKLGFNYPSHYGEYFMVQSFINPSNVAYTGTPLGLHTDLPYMSYPPQIQLLHVIKQTSEEGGRSQFADGLSVANQIRCERPEIHRILSSVPLEYVDDGFNTFRFDMTYRCPVLEYNANGELKKVQFSNQQRSWFYDLPVEELHSVYSALKVFNDYLYQPRNLLELKLNPGEMAMFANLRVLHGRTGFQVCSGAGERLLEGCYLNSDIVKSTIRVLRDKLNIGPNQVSV